MGRRNEFTTFAGVQPVQWLSDDRKITVDAMRSGAVEIRIAIGGTFMGSTLEPSEADEVAKFIADVGVHHRAKPDWHPFRPDCTPEPHTHEDGPKPPGTEQGAPE